MQCRSVEKRIQELLDDRLDPAFDSELIEDVFRVTEFAFDAKRLREQVANTYDRLVREPTGKFHFNHGPDFACELLHYERKDLEALPPECTERFAGLGNPHRIGPIRPGETVLDIGSGAGMDLLLSARRTGPTGKAIGVDPTPAMRESATAFAREAGLSEIVEIREGRAEELPVESET